MDETVGNLARKSLCFVLLQRVDRSTVEKNRIRL